MATIRKRKWQNANETTIVWQVDFVDARGRRGRRQFDSRREADAFHIQTENKIRTGTYRADASKVTVKDAAEAFLTHCGHLFKSDDHRRAMEKIASELLG